MYGHLNLLHSPTDGALSIQIPNYAAGHVIIVVVINTFVSWNFHVKSTLLNINPSTYVQISETVAYFYAYLFMKLAGHNHSAFWYLKIFIRELCFYIWGMLYIVPATYFVIDNI